MRKIQFLASLTLLSIFLTGYILQAQAASGLPNSTQFGYGATLQTNGPDLPRATRLANSIGLDWLSIELNWKQIWPDPSRGLNLAEITPAMKSARQQNISILISLVDPPAWALTANGPTPESVKALLTVLQNTFPGQVIAVELFPGANQAENWGAAANPQAYLHLVQQTQQLLSQEATTAWVIASISPTENIGIGDMDDLAFLQALYAAGPEAKLPIIGIRYESLHGEATADPVKTSGSLRHYEQVRQVMLNNGRKLDMIWVTRFCWPTDLKDPQIQAEWVYQAYERLLSQPFIGAAFFDTLNQLTTSHLNEAALINADFNLHSAAGRIQQLIAEKAPPPAQITIFEPAASEQKFSFLNWLSSLFAGFMVNK